MSANHISQGRRYREEHKQHAQFHPAQIEAIIAASYTFNPF